MRVLINIIEKSRVPIITPVVNVPAISPATGIQQTPEEVPIIVETEFEIKSFNDYIRFIMDNPSNLQKWHIDFFFNAEYEMLRTEIKRNPIKSELLEYIVELLTSDILDVIKTEMITNKVLEIGLALFNAGF